MRSHNFCVLGSALVIYNDIENNCAFTIFANDSITKIINSQNNSVLQCRLYLSQMFSPVSVLVASEQHTGRLYLDVGW